MISITRKEFRGGLTGYLQEGVEFSNILMRVRKKSMVAITGQL